MKSFTTWLQEQRSLSPEDAYLFFVMANASHEHIGDGDPLWDQVEALVSDYEDSLTDAELDQLMKEGLK